MTLSPAAVIVVGKRDGDRVRRTTISIHQSTPPRIQRFGCDFSLGSA
jgi:hypothetical protein